MKLLEKYARHQKIYNQGYRFNPEEQIFYFTELQKKWKQPEGYEDWKIENIQKDTYLKERLDIIGISEDENKVQLSTNDLSSPKKGVYAIFTSNKHGDIDILQYSLHRKVWEYEQKTTSAGTVFDENHQTRINPLWADFCAGKYDFQAAKNTPFWHPELIRLFEEREEVETLVITEGQFKAFKATKEGIPTVGLTSISHFKDGKLNTLHPEIIEFVKACNVKKVIILWDGDCRDISLKVLNDTYDNDISKRPGLFYGYACKIKELLYDFISKKTKVFFATIKTGDLDKNSKGIDDLLQDYSFDTEKIKNDLLSIGDFPSTYFDGVDISTEDGVKKLRKYFKLTRVEVFYGFHAEKIKQHSFVFQGTSYRVEKGIPIVEIPKDLKNYKRIGTDYYRIMKKPLPKIGNYLNENRYEEVLEPWTLTAIKSDYGNKADNYIERFNGFTNIANHTNYQQIIDGFWNLYSDLEHRPQPGDFPNIRKLLEHLFEEHFENEMIYDYFSVLYLMPWQKLPIIALTSRETNTGKSTFVYLMKLIFKENMYLASNQDFENNFNSHWSSKLIVASEETLLEKRAAYEMIKALATAKEVSRNEKNRNAGSIPNMLHFVMCSNNETDFLKIDKHDSRFWIRKIKPIDSTNRVKHFDKKLEEEIPYFIHFIVNREIKYNYTGDRLYFAAQDFQTEAFKNLVYNSQSELLKDLRDIIEEYFSIYPKENELTVSPIDLKDFFRIPQRYGNSYLTKILINELDAKQEVDEKGNRKLNRYYFNTTIRDTISNIDVIHRINKVGRPFVIKKEDFLKNI